MVNYPAFDGSQLCAQSDPDAWFPEISYSNEAATAKQICRRCPFQQPCLEYALHYQVDGIWGGTSLTDRRRIRRSRGIRAIPMYLTLAVPTAEALRAAERRAEKGTP